MRRGGSNLWLVLALGLLWASCTTPVHQQKWVKANSANFNLISSAGRGETREIARGLERFRAAFIKLTGLTDIDPDIPALIYVFGDSETFFRFSERRVFAGYMLQRENQNYIAIDASRTDGALATTYHEYVHFLLRNRTTFDYPAWYDEGFAELLSTLEFEGDVLAVGKIPKARGASLLYGSPLSLERVATAEDTRKWPARALSMFYAEAWALTHFLHASHAAGFPPRYEAMLRYLTLVDRGWTPEDACQEAFGMGFEALEKDFLRYVRNGQIPFFRLSASSLAVPSEVRIEALPEAQKFYHLADLALALAEDVKADPARLFEQAIQSDPNHALAHAGLARVLAQRGEAGAEAHFARAAELGKADPLVQCALASSILDRVRSSEATLAPAEKRKLIESARAHFQKSIDLDPEQVASYFGLGQTYLWDDRDVGPGIAALETAKLRLPSYEPIALTLAELHLRQGDEQAARGLLSRVVRHSHSESISERQHAQLDRLLKATGLGEIAQDSNGHLDSQLDVLAPGDGEEITGIVSLTEVKGRAGLGEVLKHDIVIAIDESESTLHATGQDVDGDGTVGVSGRAAYFPTLGRARRANTDFDDTIIQAELSAARALLDHLDPERTRVGLITFSAEGRVRSPMGLPSAARTTLDAYEVHHDLTGTSLAGALYAAIQELVASREPEERRQSSILLLSDGLPTVPTPQVGHEQALHYADLLGTHGVRVHAFALGEWATHDGSTFREIARLTGGRFVPLSRPGEIVRYLAAIRLTGLEEVRIRNRRNGELGRALRIFADGSFDAFIPLEPGENVIEIRTKVEGREEITETRTVFFRRPSAPSEEHVSAANELRKKLGLRTLETHLLVGPKRASKQERDLEIEVGK